MLTLNLRMEDKICILKYIGVKIKTMYNKIYIVYVP